MPLPASSVGPTLARRELALAPGDARLARLGPNHHLWRNGRLWWIAFTVIHDGWRQERVRHSLKTADLAEARRRRDVILRGLAATPVVMDDTLTSRTA
ncbi:MAG: hypothetical protein KJ066_23775 [Acidobacteria bacterium]|nr:hypothetical protein [Acidobacteriota bacterium]